MVHHNELIITLKICVPDEGIALERVLEDYERELLTNIVTDLRHLLMSEEHEMLRRLKPPAHPGDDEAEAVLRLPWARADHSPDRSPGRRAAAGSTRAG